MYRRRRRSEEIGFSFDSFLDVVANVVGIIIRLTLVVSVAARAYSKLHPPTVPEPALAAVPAALPPLPDDPLQAELERHHRELAEAQASLLAQLRQLQQVKAQELGVTTALTDLAQRRQRLDGERAAVQQTTRAAGAQQVSLSLPELRQRCQKLTEEVRAQAKLPSVKQALHYRTPVSKPVHSEELFFECRGGRVTYIEIAALLQEVKNRLQDRSKELRTHWETSDVVGPIGPFQLRYTLSRDHGLGEGGLDLDTPNPDSGYQWGLEGWELQPVTDARGEALPAALAPGSAFRDIADHIDPAQMTVTFWVYPDSFDVFRRLRDYLYDRDVVVAGRPLWDGTPIASSRRGTASRGQ